MAKQVYVFRVKLHGWHGVRRTIAMRRSHTLVDLHEAIRAAFGWNDERRYAFWLGGKFWAPGDTEYVPPLVPDGDSRARRDRSRSGARRRSAERRLDRLRLTTGQRIAYALDAAVPWRVRLRLREITADDGGHYPRVLDSVGQAPPQHLRCEDELEAA